MPVLGHDESHPSSGTKTWTKEQEQRAIDLLGKGLSSFKVAQIMGVTRNALNGRMHRIGFKFGKPSHARKAEIVPTGYDPIPDRGLCCYPLDGGEWCGMVVAKGKSYCPNHHSIAIDPQKEFNVKFWEMVARDG